jgi:hypothetical protein
MRLRDANILIRAVLGRRVPRLLPANDTWVWNSETTAWTQLQPANSPSARFGVLLVKDPMLKQWVLFGVLRCLTWVAASDRVCLQ